MWFLWPRKEIPPIVLCSVTLLSKLSRNLSRDLVTPKFKPNPLNSRSVMFRNTVWSVVTITGIFKIINFSVIVTTDQYSVKILAVPTAILVTSHLCLTLYWSVVTITGIFKIINFSVIVTTDQYSVKILAVPVAILVTSHLFLTLYWSVVTITGIFIISYSQLQPPNIVGKLTNQ